MPIGINQQIFSIILCGKINETETREAMWFNYFCIGKKKSEDFTKSEALALIRMLLYNYFVVFFSLQTSVF